ncbi:MAG: hypothetical protein M3R39_09530 [Actinomycetota bacterium]|nr:hypothetical protein [Actinomycetota bacterium]
MPICRVCREEEAQLSYEHVPPRAAFNEDPTLVHGLGDWLARSEDGTMSGGRIEQRGAGGRTLCERCNNNTGSWYGAELARAAAAGARILLDAPLREFDQLTEHRWAEVGLRQSATGPHPLRFIKQIVTMMLATSQESLSLDRPELGDFVLDRNRTGLSDCYRFYLSLFAGPWARSTGVTRAIDFERGRDDTLVEVAWPPYAYVMTIDSETEAIDTVDITSCVDVQYDQRADMQLSLLIGFGHTAVPVDYRTSAMIERDRERDEAGAD